MTKHPGPWKYGEDCWQIVDTNGETVVADIGPRDSEAVIEVERQRSELLAALKNTACELDACTWADMEGETERLKAAVARAEALIAKVEGR